MICCYVQGKGDHDDGKERAALCSTNSGVAGRVSTTRSFLSVSGTLTRSFVRAGVRAADLAGEGRPSIDPIVFFKLQLVLFFEGIRSERQLMRMVADRFSLRWYLGYALDEELPDHSSLTRIRQRLGIEVFERFFEKIVDLCQEAGLVW